MDVTAVLLPLALVAVIVGNGNLRPRRGPICSRA